MSSSPHEPASLTPVERLRSAMTPVRLRISTLSSPPIRIPEPDEPEPTPDPSSPLERLRAVIVELTDVQRRAVRYWKAISLEYPADREVRLVPHGRILELDQKMFDFCRQAHQAVASDVGDRFRMWTGQREVQGILVGPPGASCFMAGAFQIIWDYPVLDVPPHLEQVASDLYREERQRIEWRFDQAVREAEQRFTKTLADVVCYLDDLMPGPLRGRLKKPRAYVFRRAASLFSRFRYLNPGSSPVLDRLVAEAEQLFGRVQVLDLQQDTPELREVAEQLNQLIHEVGELTAGRGA